MCPRKQWLESLDPCHPLGDPNELQAPGLGLTELGQLGSEASPFFLGMCDSAGPGDRAVEKQLVVSMDHSRSLILRED